MIRVEQGDSLAVLATLPAESVQCVVTSPPYWGLRDYSVQHSVWGGDPACNHEWGAEAGRIGGGKQPSDKVRWQHSTDDRPHGHERAPDAAACHSCGAWRGALGLEPSPALFVAHMVEVFEKVRRVLKPDGTLWLNMGDCYANGAGRVGDAPGGGEQGDRWKGGRGVHSAENSGKSGPRIATMGPMTQPNRMPIPGLKPKDLVGMPWRLAFALQDAGWWLRQDIIWHKPNPMPESVRDRCTKAHEYLFLLTKSERYYFDADAIKEPAVSDHQSGNGFKRDARLTYQNADGSARGSDKQWDGVGGSRNKRSVWTITTKPFKGAHFATFPTALVEPCILAGSRVGDTVLDPFGGAGTVGLVADRLGRSAVLIELNPEYVDMAKRRIRDDAARRSPLPAPPSDGQLELMIGGD